jgi:hypothetical protein
LLDDLGIIGGGPAAINAYLMRTIRQDGTGTVVMLFLISWLGNRYNTIQCFLPVFRFISSEEITSNNLLNQAFLIRAVERLYSKF